MAAFEAFYVRYFERVTGYAAGRLDCAEDVADVVAQTFVRLLDTADRYDPTRGDPTAFVLGITANLAHDVHRRRARQRRLTSRLVGRDLLDDDDVARIDAAIDAARTSSVAAVVLDTVPDGEREMLQLVANGRTPGQAADELGISRGAGWTRLSRARSRVRTRLVNPEENR
jgi:RNA polymerase sigma-70 factor (ECF subfamily)